MSIKLATPPVTPSAPPKKYIGQGQLAILTVVVVASLRSLATTATFGLGSVTLYIVPALIFLVPTALVAAELATGWKGGVYVWVREALGNRWGFQAIWLQWIQSVVWYPVQLAFIAAAVAFVIGDQNLASSGLFTAAVIVALYYFSTFVGLRGGTLFAKVGSWGGVIGTLVPGALLIGFGIVWLALGMKSQTPLQLHDVVPPFSGLSSIVLIVSSFLAYAGMEVNAVHVNQMHDPRKDYPKAILLASGIILGVFVIPTIAIALIVPKSQLGLTTGIMQTFKLFFGHLGAGWVSPVLAAAVAVGAFASVVTWIAGPSKGLLLAGETGVLPRVLQRRNAAGVQSGILVLQAVIVTVLAALFVVIPDVSASFFTLVDMAAALYLIMYMLMFASAIVLRRTKPDVPRSYRVPAMTLVAGIGFAASLAAFLLGFVPPSGLSGIPASIYPYVVGAVILALGAPPLVFYALRKPSWVTAEIGDDTHAVLGFTPP
jgi:glutamate:GABA antiporter